MKDQTESDSKQSSDGGENVLIPDEREKVQLLTGSVHSAAPVSILGVLSQSPVQNHSPLRHVQCSELQLRPFVTHKHNPPVAHLVSKLGLAIHQNDHQARRRFAEWAQNEIAVVPDFHKRILFSDEAHFWLNGYVNKQNCRIWSEANPQVYVETPLHPEKLTVWCALWAGGILLQKR
ncbi:hypothetical protein TNCV_790881 [Trichonephila clavipes]|nr:hypothetical protein TNCV_790881 [Trichonephila clavipes]